MMEPQLSYATKRIVELESLLLVAASSGWSLRAWSSILVGTIRALASHWMNQSTRSPPRIITQLSQLISWSITQVILVVLLTSLRTL